MIQGHNYNRLKVKRGAKISKKKQCSKYNKSSIARSATGRTQLEK